MFTSGTPPKAAIFKAWLSPNMAAASDVATFGHVVANKEFELNQQMQSNTARELQLFQAIVLMNI